MSIFLRINILLSGILIYFSITLNLLCVSFLLVFVSSPFFASFQKKIKKFSFILDIFIKRKFYVHLFFYSCHYYWARNSSFYSFICIFRSHILCWMVAKNFFLENFNFFLFFSFFCTVCCKKIEKYDISFQFFLRIRAHSPLYDYSL